MSYAVLLLLYLILIVAGGIAFLEIEGATERDKCLEVDRSIRKLKEAAEEQRIQQQELQERKMKREKLLRRFEIENDAEKIEQTDRRYRRSIPASVKCSNAAECKEIFHGFEGDLSISKDFEIEFEFRKLGRSVDQFRFMFYF